MTNECGLEFNGFIRSKNINKYEIEAALGALERLSKDVFDIHENERHPSEIQLDICAIKFALLSALSLQNRVSEKQYSLSGVVEIQEAMSALADFKRQSWDFHLQESQSGISRVPRDAVFYAAELKKKSEILYAALQSQLTKNAENVTCENLSNVPETQQVQAETVDLDVNHKLREQIGLAIGEASMCWSEIPTGTFHSERATEIVDRLFNYITRKTK